MDHQHIREILERYHDQLATEEEIGLLESWYLFDQKEPLPLSMDERVRAVDTVWSNLQHAGTVHSRMRLWKRLAVSACLVLISGLVVYLMRSSGTDPAIFASAQDIPSGKNTATLTLSDGRRVVLNSAGAGSIANQAGISITRSNSGELVYTAKETLAADTNAINSLETYRGEQHQLILPDGTHVWLNASSKISYPVGFSEHRRMVELEGEAYFEVTHDGRRPFIVKTSRQTLTVLGTRFNVNCYEDEPGIKTTLLEGSVRIETSLKQGRVLRPGQQSLITGTGISVGEADIEVAVAWKNGLIMFENQPITEIMRQISRWYNVEIVYQGELPADSFSGMVDRYSNVSQVLKKLQLTDKVHFKIEERRIIVTR